MIEPVEVAKKIVDAVEKDGSYIGSKEGFDNFNTIMSYIYKMGMYTIKNNGDNFYVKKRINHTDVLRKTITAPGTWEVKSPNKYIISTYMNKYWTNWAYEATEIGDGMYEIKFLYKKDPIRDKIKDMKLSELKALNKWIEGLIQSKM